MSSNLLPFPHPSTREIRARAVPVCWTRIDGYLTDNGFLSSWLEDESQPDGINARRRMNWGAITGLAISLAISATFWAGLGVLVSRLLK